MPGDFSGPLISLFHKRGTAPDQGGLLTGENPSNFNTNDPLRIWIIQLCYRRGSWWDYPWPNCLWTYPRVHRARLPLDTRPYLSLVANIGLVLFLFIVGLEIDASIIKRYARLSLQISLAGMILPFGLGAALSKPLYERFIDPSVVYTHFLLFTGVAYSITAFPVLCRILTELALLDTNLGIVVLSAGVGNDIVGWTLLALSVALVNAGSGLTALWILMTCVGWALFILFPVKYAFAWLARKTGSVENGPTIFFMTSVVLMCFGSAFFTDVIGVHAIFGAFLMGLIVPREGKLNIVMTEKLEDMVSIIFLPLYFTLSGLSTNLGLLDNGITWAYTIAIICLAFFGKFVGCSVAARFAGFSWREASTVGSLMSCKGLVELIVLNVGLSAGILSQRVFSMFVLEALTLTCATTPLVTWLYPPEKRVRVVASGGVFRTTGDAETGSDASTRGEGEVNYWKSKFTVVLDKIDHLPGIMALTQMLQPSSLSIVAETATSSKAPLSTDLFVDALRLIELSDRISAVMKAAPSDTLLHADPLLSIFKMFGELNQFPVSTSLSIVPYEQLAVSVADHATETSSDLIVIPWLPASQAVPAAETPARQLTDGAITPKLPQSPTQHSTHNPFDALFKASTSHQAAPAAVHSHFVRGVFSKSKTNVALFIDQGHNPGAIHAQHIYLPFFGGPDDRLALEFVVQLCSNRKISATIVRVTRREASVTETPSQLAKEQEAHGATVASITSGFPDTVYGHATTHTRMQSETKDSVYWAKFAHRPTVPKHGDPPLSPTLTAALTRVTFRELPTPNPLRAITEEVSALVTSADTSRVLVAVGRSRRLAVEDHRVELKGLMEEGRAISTEVKNTIGDVATAFMSIGKEAGLIVLQAANVSSE